MNQRNYLNEERYRRSKRWRIVSAVLVWLVGLTIALSLIGSGWQKHQQARYQHSDEYREILTEQLEAEREVLEAKKAELEAKGIKYSVFAKYTDGEAYDLMIVTDVLDPSASHTTWFEKYTENPLTAEYCAIKQQMNEAKENMEFDTFIHLYILGGFAIFTFGIIGLTLFETAVARERLAFFAQQTMPIMKEGIEEITPTVSSAAREMTRARARGVREGFFEEERYCKFCREAIPADSMFCNKCGRKQ